MKLYYMRTLWWKRKIVVRVINCMIQYFTIVCTLPARRNESESHIEVTHSKDILCATF